MRAGTLNVPGIAGLGVALAARTEGFADAVEALATMRDAFETRLLDRLGNSVSFNGAAAERVPNTSNARFEGIDGMRLLALLVARVTGTAGTGV
jgi:cysteine desulfurase